MRARPSARAVLSAVCVAPIAVTLMVSAATWNAPPAPPKPASVSGLAAGASPRPTFTDTAPTPVAAHSATAPTATPNMRLLGDMQIYGYN